MTNVQGWILIAAVCLLGAVIAGEAGKEAVGFIFCVAVGISCSRATFIPLKKWLRRLP
jgi:hypothetical protein